MGLLEWLIIVVLLVIIILPFKIKLIKKYFANKNTETDEDD